MNEVKLKINKINNIRTNITNINKIKLSKFDIIIDCCAEPSVEASKNDLDKVLNTNFIGTYSLLKKCIADKSSLIFLSTSRVYNIEKIKSSFRTDNLRKKIQLKKEIGTNFSTEAPRSVYGFTKLASEELIKELSYIYNFKFIINRLGVIAGPGQMGREDQGFVSLWVWRHLNKLPLKYIGFGGYGNQMRDLLHVEDLNLLILEQIKKIKEINNITISAGGGKTNLISLRELTKICQNLTGNKIKFIKVKKTSLYDIPYFCTSNYLAKNIYNWKPKKKIIDIVRDAYDWQKKNYKILKNYLN